MVPESFSKLQNRVRSPSQNTDTDRIHSDYKLSILDDIQEV